MARNPALGALAALLFLLPGCAAPPWQRVEVERPAMGTRFRVVVWARDPSAARAAAEAALDRVSELDARLTDWDEDSELSRLSARTDDGPVADVPVSPDLARVLASACAVSAETGGAFDVTVGPLVRLWRRSRRQGELPAPAHLAAARAAVSWRAVDVDPAAGRASLGLARMRLDLGGIAKGYALDEALAVLAARGFERALVDGGGDVAVGDPPPGRAGWRVALVADAGDLTRGAPSLSLARAACATSGDLYQSVEIDGVVYGHVVDPRTGLGSTRRTAASVVAPTGMQADAWASALCVLGPEVGLPLVEGRPELEARVVEAAPEGPAAQAAAARACESSGLARMMAEAPPSDPSEQDSP